MDIKKLKTFSESYYHDKDIMHNLWHIELVHKWVDRIIAMSNYCVDYEIILCALYFHGFIYKDEQETRRWLSEQGVLADRAEIIIRVAWESQRSGEPETIEGKILHDAHVLEGGVAYQIVKTLITGSVRGQTLTETIEYMKKNVIDKNRCFLPETIGLCRKMNEYSKEFIREIEQGIN